MSDFSGRNVLVVGGSSGIGLALSKRLIAAGASLHLWSRSRPEDLDPGRYTYSPVDVLKPLAEQNPETPNALHGLAYCPGSITLASFQRLKEEQFLDDFQLNLLGAVRVLQHCLRSLVPQESSVVMFSTVAVQTGFQFHASIASAKGAVEGLVRSLAAEFAPKGVRFNAVAPSLTATPLAGSLLSTEDKRTKSGQRHPLGRIGKASDQASAAEYLLSSDSGWITGQVLRVDGGYSSVRLL